MTKRFYSVEEAADILGFNADTVRQWCRDGQLRAVKGAGRTSRYRIREDWIQEWTDRNLYRP